MWVADIWSVYANTYIIQMSWFLYEPSSLIYKHISFQWACSYMNSHIEFLWQLSIGELVRGELSRLIYIQREWALFCYRSSPSTWCICQGGYIFIVIILFIFSLQLHTLIYRNGFNSSRPCPINLLFPVLVTFIENVSVSCV